MASSRISQIDFNNNKGYLTVDLSRRYNQDIDAPLSLQISGTLLGLKNYDLFCFIEYEKSAEIDVMNGKFNLLGLTA